SAYVDGEYLQDVEGEAGQASRIGQLKQSADQGNAAAMNALGLLYEDRDPREAVKWFQLASLAGHGYASNNLDSLLRSGRAPREYALEALRYHHRLAVRDAGDSRSLLARLYEHGIYLERDPAAAEKWYRLAADFQGLGAMYFALCCRCYF